MRLKIFFASLMVMALATVAEAGPLFLNIVLAPATTAGGGATNSATSGPNAWHLYALDTTDGSLGIAAIGLSMTNITGIRQLSPVTDWDNADPDTGPFKAGFGPTRSTTDMTVPIGATANPYAAVQPLVGDAPLLDGFGREASSFAAKLAPFAPTSISGTVSGSWGAGYLTAPHHPWLLLAEGTWNGITAPSINMTTAHVQIYTAIDNAQGTGTTGETDEVLNGQPPPLGEPPLVTDVIIPNINASEHGVGNELVHIVQQTGGTLPVGWVPGPPTLFDNYTPAYGAPPGAPGAAEAANATFNPLDQQFSWNTVGAPRGIYRFKVTASNAFGSDPGFVTVHITQVPEPASIALFGIAMVGTFGLVRRRNG